MENHEAQAPDAGRLPTGDLQGLLERAQARLIKLPHGTDIAPLASRAISALLRNIVTHHALVYRLRNDLSGLQDTDMLLQLVGAVAEEEPLTDKWALLRARGRQALNQLLESSGGSLAPGQVAELLGISPDAVRKRRSKGQLLGLRRGAQTHYPAFQFDERGVLPDLPDILALLDTDSDAAKLRFFLLPDDDLDGTPANALRERRNLALVRRKAKQFGQQGAR